MTPAWGGPPVRNVLRGLWSFPSSSGAGTAGGGEGGDDPTTSVPVHTTAA